MTFKKWCVFNAGVTEIQAHWLVEVAAPLCEISEALEQPPAAYAPVSDAVMAWHDVSFGRHAWALPRLRCPHPDQNLRVRAFAAALLDGSVLPSMAGGSHSLTSNPFLLQAFAETSGCLAVKGACGSSRRISKECNQSGSRKHVHT